MKRRLAGLACLIASAVLLAAGCAGSGEADDPGKAASGSEATAPESSREAGAHDFYAEPDDLADHPPGALIRSAEVKKTPSGVLYRVMYASQSLEGDPIAVTGLVGVPTGDAPAGGRPVLGYAHWTTGLADECAPSRMLDATTERIIDGFMSRGMVVAATDYEGLGTPGLHAYLVGESEARGVLDAIRAAREVPGSQTSDRAVVWGHSQGGHAALFTAQLAADWAPEIDLVGAAAGAPPSEFSLLSETVGDSTNLGYLAMIAAGISAAVPEAELDDILTSEAIDLLDVVEEECVAGVLQAFSGRPASEIVAADPGTVTVWREAIAATDPGHAKSDVPLFVFHGADDELVPARGSEILFGRLCSLGQVVERKVYEGQNHGGVVLAAMGDLVAWLEARLAGTPAPSTCPKA